jgi:hypothetical protein
MNNPSDISPIHLAGVFLFIALVLAAIEWFIGLYNLAFYCPEDEGDEPTIAQLEPDLPPPFAEKDEAEYRRRHADYANRERRVTVAYPRPEQQVAMSIMATKAHLN